MLSQISRNSRWYICCGTGTLWPFVWLGLYTVLLSAYFDRATKIYVLDKRELERFIFTICLRRSCYSATPLEPYCHPCDALLDKYRHVGFALTQHYYWNSHYVTLDVPGDLVSHFDFVVSIEPADGITPIGCENGVCVCSVKNLKKKALRKIF